eukprot:jgi/Ulvmu1/1247/UM109_0045.1
MNQCLRASRRLIQTRLKSSSRSTPTSSIAATMKVNAEFDQKAIVHADMIQWVPSPMAGVERKMLDRIGDEVARATSIVRYAPGSTFPRHTHGGGEEYLVLEGAFQDDTGDFPVGRYVRNPPQSAHTPSSEPGCTIFVKLWQMDPEDRSPVNIDINKADLQPGSQEGVQAATLFQNSEELVEVQSWGPGTSVCVPAEGGLEVLLLKGNGQDTESGELLREGSWVRVPPNGSLNVCVGENGAQVWMKRGHLAAVRGLHLATAAA